MPRFVAVVAAALLAGGCNEIRYQSARLRANAPPLELPKVAELPDRRVPYECKNGEPFEVFFTPGGTGVVLSLGGEEYALRDLAASSGERYGDGRYELYIDEDESAYVALDDKRVREGCRRR